MQSNSLFKALLLMVSFSVLISCDKEFSEIGDSLIGENNFDLTSDKLSTVEATWKKTGAIGANNLDINSLGVLDNAAFGQTTAHFATQVQLANTSPVVDSDLKQVVESVTLYIPYSTKAAVTNNAEGRPIYALDSIYGNITSKIKLNIYENKFELDNINTEGFPAPLVDPSYPQFYYTNQNADFSSNKGELLYSNSSFVFSPNEFKVTTPAVGTTLETTAYIAPGMRVDLPIAFFQSLLFDKSKPGYDLSSNRNFEKYFKGLYFNVEKADAVGVLNRINFKRGTIVVKYKEKALAADQAVSVEKSITLNLAGNTVNLLNNEPSTGIGSYSNPNPDRLYLRGGEGSVAIIDLFNSAIDVVTYNRKTKKIELDKKNGIPDELDYLKAKGWLINEASLTFYVDQALMNNVREPSKIFLYNINNQIVLSGAILERDSGDKGVKYRAIITDYIRGLVNNDNENAKLGVSIAQLTSNIKFKKTKDAPAYSIWKELTLKDKNTYFFPETSVISPLGTILYGSGTAVQDDKRLKLEIYYTKPN